MGCGSSAPAQIFETISPSLCDTIGPTLLTSNRTVKPTISLLSNKKMIIFYFAAYYDTHCKAFTPILLKFYNDMRAKDSNSIEVIFVSSDNDKDEFFYHVFEHTKMPWLSVQFADRKRKDDLCTFYRIGSPGIPSMIIVRASDGSVLNTNGYEMLKNDPKGVAFPWKQPSLRRTIGGDFVDSEQNVISAADAFSGKFIFLYFASSVSEKCSEFTERLISVYDSRHPYNDLEIILCSSDNMKEAFDDYLSELPWVALPCMDRRISELSKRFNVQEIPRLVVIDPNGLVINDDAVRDVVADEYFERFPYIPDPVVDLAMGPTSYGYSLRSKLSFVLFVDMLSPAAQSAAKAAVMPLANRYSKNRVSQANGPDMLFFIATTKSGAVFMPKIDMWVPGTGDSIRYMTGLIEPRFSAKPSAVIIDKTNDVFYLSPTINSSSTLTTDNFTDFIESYYAERLETRSMSDAVMDSDHTFMNRIKPTSAPTFNEDAVFNAIAIKSVADKNTPKINQNNFWECFA